MSFGTEFYAPAYTFLCLVPKFREIFLDYKKPSQNNFNVDHNPENWQNSVYFIFQTVYCLRAQNKSIIFRGGYIKM